MRRTNFSSKIGWGVAATVLFSTLSTVPVGASTDLVARALFPSSLLASVPLARLHFSGPVDATKLPSITTRPALETSWQQIGPNDVRAVTTTELVPNANYLIGVPTRISCTTVCVSLARVARTVKAGGSELWLQQLLAAQNYLPVEFHSAVNDPMALTPGPGSMVWRFPTLARLLQSKWRVGLPNIIEQGAIMRFQDDHHLATSGVADNATWTALLRAAADVKVSPKPYSYVDVSMVQPETLTLYVNGVATFHSYVNTGIPQSTTAPGTYPVYLRYTTTTMSGTNPDGTKYHDTGIPWVSYFHGGDALHGFLRYSYGSPQSLGCVEMRFNDAKAIFYFTPIGTLVTVR